MVNYFIIPRALWFSNVSSRESHQLTGAKDEHLIIHILQQMMKLLRTLLIDHRYRERQQ